jgi:hypothetical protein
MPPPLVTPPLESRAGAGEFRRDPNLTNIQIHFRYGYTNIQNIQRGRK